ncbi:hypothetical protein ZWY2020_027525 [Hordeum vulgare]|nr:hypothetical protein ZWY2020_027525 [Hordeum vulgare]
MRKAYTDSLKVLEADIQHANTLEGVGNSSICPVMLHVRLFIHALTCMATEFSREYDGACLQMRLSFNPAVHIFLFLVPWTDCSLAGALGLMRILIYKVYVDGTTTMSTHERKEEECGICMEMSSKVVLPSTHAMCLGCYRLLVPSCVLVLGNIIISDSWSLWISRRCGVTEMQCMNRETIIDVNTYSMIYLDRVALDSQVVFFLYSSTN